MFENFLPNIVERSVCLLYIGMINTNYKSLRSQTTDRSHAMSDPISPVLFRQYWHLQESCKNFPT